MADSTLAAQPRAVVLDHLLDRRPGCSPAVIGVVNVTPDSFSDGGRWLDPARAVAHGVDLAATGADLVDVGGESTRPGADRPDLETELARVVPVVCGLVRAGVGVSVDTMRSEVARAALDAGACLVNDVSGGAADPAMFGVVAAAGVPYVCMHWRGHARSMQERTTYDDVVTDVIAELQIRLTAAAEAGLDPDRIIVDPGIGFAKTYAHNWSILRRIDEFAVLGRPVLVAVSRKAFLGALLRDDAGDPRPADGRDQATAAISALLATSGIWGLRVHDVASTVDAVAVARELGRSPASGPPSELPSEPPSERAVAWTG